MTKEIVLLIPSLNPNHKLIRTVESMIEAGFERILLVNDGSDKDHLGPFKELDSHEEVTVIGYEQNQGKGYALKYGFDYIIKNFEGILGVVTADGDGQHLAQDCIKTAEAMIERNEPIFGCRNFKDPKVPKRNRAGNTISIFVYNYLCGIKISDTQTGLRAIPASLLPEFCKVEGNRFEYETNTLIYLNANDIHYSEVPISTVYEEDSNEGSHFRVVEDSIKIYKPILKYGGARFGKFLVSSVLSAVLDLGLFTLIGLFWNSIPGATAVARVVSSIFNYLVNRNAVFKKGKTKNSVVRYYILAVCQLCASALFVTLLCKLFGAVGFAKTVVKFFVDLILFFISFKIQREWVFK